MTDSDTSLSDLQLDLMRVLWQRNEASVAEVVDALSGQRDLAHTTVATLLTRLEKRALVASRMEGRQRIYSARVAEQAVRRGMVATLLGSLFGGSAQDLLAHLVSEREINHADLAEIEALLRPDTAAEKSPQAERETTEAGHGVNQKAPR